MISFTHEIVELAAPKEKIDAEFGSYFKWFYTVEEWVKDNIKELPSAEARTPPVYQMVQIGQKLDMYRIIIAFNDPANAVYFSLTWL